MYTIGIDFPASLESDPSAATYLKAMGMYRIVMACTWAQHAHHDAVAYE